MELAFRGRRLMYVYCIGAWRMLGHSRHSPCPLSSLKGFTLELLKVWYVCTHAAAVSFAGTAVARRRSLTGSGGSSTLGLLQRSLVATCLFVPRRNRKIYWGYVVQPANGASVESMWLIETVSVSHLGLAQCYVTAIDSTKCHVNPIAMTLWLLMIVQGR